MDARAILPDLVSRGRAPRSVLDWNRFETWRRTAWRLTAEELGADVREEFLRRPPEYIVGDDLGWLDKIVRRVTGRTVDTKSLMAAKLAARYGSIRACHATRTAEVDRYYHEGLRPLDPNEAQSRAAAHFLGGDFPELRPADLERAAREVGSGLRAGCVFFEANEQALISDAGHYLLYGGEYVTAIAAHLRGARDYRQALKAVGAPTMFVCDVPLRAIGGHTLLEFAGTALEMMFEALQQGRSYRPDAHRGAGFCIREILPPSCIVGHYHPARIRDPFRGYAVVD